MAPSDWHQVMARPGLAFIPGLPRVSSVASHAGPERRPRTVATPQGRRPHVGNDLFPLSPLDEHGQKSAEKQRTPYRHSDEARRKISAANKGNVPWNKGRKHSEETKRKIAAATKIAMKAPKVREKLRQQATGRKHSDETKRKIRHASLALHGRPLSAPSRKPRRPVPFKFSTDLVAALDSRIAKRYKKEFIDDAACTASGRLRRPMSAETKKKLSAKIKEMWASRDYRDKVMNGIEAHNRRRETSPLSEAHKEAIRQTLLKRHAELRQETGRGMYQPRRRPRSSSSGLDPTAGTRFSDRKMSSASLREREQRRLRISQILFEAEEKEHEELRQFQAAQQLAERRRMATETERRRSREERDRRETNRMLLESLAKAGQLPSLEEEGPNFESSQNVGASSLSEGGNSFFDFTQVPLEETDFLGPDISMGSTSPMKDPLLCPPEPPLLSPALSSVQPNFNDIFVSIDEQSVGSHHLPFSETPSTFPNTASIAKKSGRRQLSEQDDSLGIPLTESVPLGQRLAFEEAEEERDANDAEVDEDDDESLELNYEDDISNTETNMFVSSQGLTESLGNIGSGESDGAFGYTEDRETASSVMSAMAPSSANKRIVTYVNGKRVLQSSSS